MIVEPALFGSNCSLRSLLDFAHPRSEKQVLDIALGRAGTFENLTRTRQINFGCFSETDK
jgi:hypothetical protein